MIWEYAEWSGEILVQRSLMTGAACCEEAQSFAPAGITAHCEAWVSVELRPVAQAWGCDSAPWEDTLAQPAALACHTGQCSGGGQQGCVTGIEAKD